MFKKPQNQSSNENDKKPFFQKVRNVAHTIFWLGGPSFSELNKEIDNSIHEIQEFRKKSKESRKELYKDFCKK